MNDPSIPLDEWSLTNQLDESGEERLYRALRHFWHPVAYAAEGGDRPAPATFAASRSR